MPRYTYECGTCEILFEKIHSMAEKLVDCGYCGSEKSLKRIPGSFRFINGESQRNNTRPGDVIRNHIEEAREDIRQQKEDMTKEYES
jgi:putative FmdB family regulatory protein